MAHLVMFVSFVLFAAGSAAPAQVLTERATFPGHKFHVNRAALSADGKLFASGEGSWREGELKLWDANSGKEIVALPGYTDSLYDLAFSPNGKLLATAGVAPLQLWDTRAHTLVRTFHENSEPISTVAFSSDGKKVAALGGTKATVWDVMTGKKVAAIQPRRPNLDRTCVFSPDLETLAVHNFQEIDLWDMTTGKLRETLAEHVGQISFLGYGSGAKTLIAASSRYRQQFKYHGDLKLWDAATAKERVSFKGPFGRVVHAALSPNGRILAVLDSPDPFVDPDLKLVDVASGKQSLIKSPRGHSFQSLTFTDGNKLFVIGTPDRKTWKLWEVSLP